MKDVPLTTGVSGTFCDVGFLFFRMMPRHAPAQGQLVLGEARCSAPEVAAGNAL